MRGQLNPDNRYGDPKVIDACSLFGVMDTSGKRFAGHQVFQAISNMHDRSNGLGGGFAIYGLYPDLADYYALHLMYMDPQAREQTETLLKSHFRVFHSEAIPVRSGSRVQSPPELWRYFVLPQATDGEGLRDDDDAVVRRVMQINSTIAGTFVFSSGKNMGVFKGVGFPEDVADFFRLDEYQGYMWTAHGRFPTNTPGWWGGAHPFNILDWTVVHNGELSSYGINRRYLEMFGYYCTLQTDTEVIAYAVDLLVRRHGLPVEVMAKVLAPPLWDAIERSLPRERDLLTALRQVYASLLLNGPFTIIIAHQGEMIGLTDRIRLRPLTAAVKGQVMYLSSEEAAIRLVSPGLDRVWKPRGGEPVIGRVGAPVAVPSEGSVQNSKVASA